MESNVSIVTAFFDIGREKWEGWSRRTIYQYFSSFSYLAQMNVEMVIYTESKFKDKIEEIRNSFGFADKTKIIVWENFFEHSLVEKIQKVMDDEFYKSLPTEPECPEYWSSEYVYVNMCKSEFVCDAIENQYVTNDQVAWIDFGYCKEIDTLPKSRIWNYNFEAGINLFQMKELDNKSVIDIMRTNAVYIQGCHIVATNKSYWKFLKDLVWFATNSMLDCGIIDDDQTMLLMAYRSDPKLFKLNYIDINEDGWFVIFKKYNNAE